MNNQNNTFSAMQHRPVAFSFSLLLSDLCTFWCGTDKCLGSRWKTKGRQSLGSGQPPRECPPASHRGSPGPDGDPDPGPERELGKHAGVLPAPLTTSDFGSPPCALCSFCFTKAIDGYHQ